VVASQRVIQNNVCYFFLKSYVYFVLIALKKEAKYPSKIINIKNMIKKDKSIKKAKILIRNKKIKKC